MTLTPRERLAAVLDRQFGKTACAATASADPGLLDLGVAGLGRIALPITPSKAKQLRELAAPAKYGKGTQTLTDASVRDTWEVPRETVQVSWEGGFDAVLASIRDDLSLPPTCTLRPELHSNAGLRAPPVLPSASGLRKARRHGRDPRRGAPAPAHRRRTGHRRG
jgi:hypothetical protein